MSKDRRHDFDPHEPHRRGHNSVKEESLNSKFFIHFRETPQISSSRQKRNIEEQAKETENPMTPHEE